MTASSHLKIDIHTHILPPDIPKFSDLFGYSGFIRLQHEPGCSHVNMVSDTGQFFRRIEENCFDPVTRLKECDQLQIDVQVLSTVPVMFSYWTKPADGLTVSRYLNDHIAEVVSKNPKRFVGLGTLPMQSIDLAIKEAERAIKQLGLIGFQIGSNVNDVNLGEPQFHSLYSALQDLGASVFVHPWNMMGEKHMQKYWLPWLVGMPAETSRAICSLMFAGVFEKFPRLRFAFAHGGGSFPFTIGRIDHGHSARPDLVAIDCKIPPKDFLGHFWIDSLVHDSRALQFLIDLIGEKRICLGTDYPFPLGEVQAGQLITETDLSVQTRRALFCDSALEWMNLTEKHFLRS